MIRVGNLVLLRHIPRNRRMGVAEVTVFTVYKTYGIFRTRIIAEPLPEVSVKLVQ